MQEEKNMDDDSNDNIIMDQNNKPLISVKNLNFSYTPDRKDIVNLNCIVPPNSKVILVGANGMCRLCCVCLLSLCISCVYFHYCLFAMPKYTSPTICTSLILSSNHSNDL